jgi:hypothetical protein
MSPEHDVHANAFNAARRISVRSEQDMLRKYRTIASAWSIIVLCFAISNPVVLFVCFYRGGYDGG